MAGCCESIGLLFRERNRLDSLAGFQERLGLGLFLLAEQAPPRMDFVLNVVKASGSLASRIVRASGTTTSASAQCLSCSKFVFEDALEGPALATAPRTRFKSCSDCLNLGSPTISFISL